MNGQKFTYCGNFVSEYMFRYFSEQIFRYFSREFVQEIAYRLGDCTRHCIHQAVRPIAHRYRTDLMSMKVRRSKVFVYSDTGFVKVASLKQHTCYQGYSLESFVYIHPMPKQTEARDHHRQCQTVISTQSPKLISYSYF